MMNKEEIFRKIGGIITELTEQYQYLSENLENINHLELELFTANSRFLTDHVEILQKLNAESASSAASQKAHQQHEENAFEKEKLHADAQSTHTASEEDIHQPVLNQDEETQAEEKSYTAAKHEEEEYQEAAPEPAIEEHPTLSQETAQTPESESEPAASAGSAPLAETQAEEIVQEIVIPEKKVNIEIPAQSAEPAPKPTLNELISIQKSQNPAAGVNRPKHIGDLKTAISLNDKLMFIKELFNGYSLAYSEAIEILNRFETFEAADTFLQTNYAEKNNWAAKSQAADKLYELLKSKYQV